jgi:hypothetical protein
MRAWLVALALLFVPSVVADDTNPPEAEPAPEGEAAPEAAADSEAAAVGQDEDPGRPAPAWYSQDPETGQNGIHYGGEPSKGLPPTWYGGEFIPIGVLPECPIGLTCPG